MTQIKPSVYGDTLEDIQQQVCFERSFTKKQLGNWLYEHGVTSTEAITNISKRERNKLTEKYDLPSLTLLNGTLSGKSATKKFLFETQDKHKIEAVLIDNNQNGFTLCLSSQVGCTYNCTFCATGKMVFGRNLNAGEIVEQYILLNKESEGSIKNIVYMGMGEPFANLKNVFKSIDLLTDPNGIGMSSSRISVSTIGLLAGIKAFSDYDKKVNLLISLHSARQQIRNEIMPNMVGQDLISLKEALLAYQNKKRLKITIEYIMLEGINDTQEDMDALIAFCDGLDLKVNLIAHNKHPFVAYEPSKPQVINDFKEYLSSEDLQVVQRYKKGDDIAAACGQLAIGIKH